MSDLLYKIAVTRIPNVGPVLARQLVAWCGGVKEVFNTPKKELLKIPGIGKASVDNIMNKISFSLAEEELKFIEKNNIEALFYLDKKFPQRLVHYNDAPLMLYYKGSMDLNHPRTVGIVGTRKPTEYGKLICQELVEGLKEYNVSIISGLAYGIDVTAHKKSVQIDIPTIGCLGHGLHMIYPAAHKNVAKNMISNGGLLTEFTSKERPDAPHFPMRNRIIAGLSDALIVVETPKSGGSMISAEMANNYNKDVFAVPGRLKDNNSLGCNFLIKTHKAQLIESAEDIAYIMRWEKGATNKHIQKQLFVDLNPLEKKVVENLESKENESIDALSYQTGFSQSELAMILLDLEFKGMIKSLPGKRYMLI
jgi:DNA processing protein